MRTKHLLTAMVLPALLAACTNDDFESLSQTAPSIEGRAMVDNVTLNVLPSAGTRLTWDGGYSWEEGDGIGACLMDELGTDYATPNALWHKRFNLVNYIQTNYKFTRGKTAEWTTEAKMCEGNYFFVYPYNANKGSRDAYSFELDAQVLEGTDNASMMKAYTANNAFVGFGKVVAGDAESENVNVAMLPVFGGTGIVIENQSSLPFTVQKIVVKGTKVAQKVTIDPTACESTKQYSSNVTAAQVSGTSNYYFNVAQYTQDATEAYTLGTGGLYDPDFVAPNYDAEDALADALTVDYNGNYDDGSGNKGGVVEVTFKGGNTIQNDESINVIVMLAPTDAAYSSGKEVLVDIYTDRGVVEDIVLNKEDEDKGDDITVLGALDALGKGGKVTVALDAKAFQRPGSTEIGSTADLLNLIQWRADVQAPITATLNSDLTITKAVYDALKASDITEANITMGAHNVTIDAGATDGTLDAFKFSGTGNVIIKGTQSMTVAPAAPVEVAAGATLNITKAVALTNEVTNNGTLNVKANVSASTGIQKINNEGTMTVAADARVICTTRGSLEVQVVNGNNAGAAGVLTNAGTIDVLYANYAKGEVTNTGVIGRTAVDCGNNVGGVITNDGTGKIYLNTNSGVIYANGQSGTKLNNNADSGVNGTIVITNLDESRGNIQVTGTEGYIAQEIAAESSVKDIDTRANAVWLSAKLNIDVTDTDGDYTDQSKNVTVIATDKNAEIYGHNQKLTLTGLAVNAGAELRLVQINVEVSSATSVALNGVAGNPAKLTVNTNATLKASGGSDVTVTEDANNIYENWSK